MLFIQKLKCTSGLPPNAEKWSKLTMNITAQYFKKIQLKSCPEVLSILNNVSEFKVSFLCKFENCCSRPILKKKKKS